MHVINIINGAPRAGKDTFASLVIEEIKLVGQCKTSHFSSIDPIRNALQEYELISKAKTPANRQILAEVGEVVERVANVRSEYCISKIRATMKVCNNSVFFIHIREPEVIERIKRAKLVWQHQFRTIYVESEYADKEFSNSVDAGTEAYEYDHVVQNNGTINDLRDKARDYARTLIPHVIPTDQFRIPAEGEMFKKTAELIGQSAAE